MAPLAVVLLASAPDAYQAGAPDRSRGETVEGDRERILDPARRPGGRITGRVLDFENARPVAGAVVGIPAAAVKATTAGDGRFALPDLPPSRYLLEVTHPDYQPYVDSITISGRDDVELEIHLLMDPVELEPLTVDAPEREDLELRRRGTRVDIITREEIEAIGAARHAGDLLRGIPELVVREGGGDGIPTGVCVESRRSLGRNLGGTLEPERAWCGRMVQIYLNGVPIVDGTTFLRTLRPDEIGRIEYLSPIEARARYGRRGEFGALLIETRLRGET